MKVSSGKPCIHANTNTKGNINNLQLWEKESLLEV